MITSWRRVCRKIDDDLADRAPVGDHPQGGRCLSERIHRTDMRCHGTGGEQFAQLGFVAHELVWWHVLEVESEDMDAFQQDEIQRYTGMTPEA